MIPGLALVFAHPWLLAALVLLPAIWWLLRFTPPRPNRIAFPPTRILLELGQKEETPSTTPWWLVLLRIVIAALVILALARPVLNPPAVVTADEGPLLVVVDDGWSSAPVWGRITAAADQILARAQSDQRPVLLVAVSGDRAVGPLATAAAARERLAGLSSMPHEPDRAGLADDLAEAVARHDIAEIVWLADGLEHGDGAAFADSLAGTGANVRVMLPGEQDLPLALAPAANDPGGLVVSVLRATAGGVDSATVLARDLRGRVIGETEIAFASGETGAVAEFDLPVEIRNEIARLEIVGVRAAGAVQLLDDRWRRRVVGLVSGESREAAQPLLSPLYYITRALGPFADLRQAPDPNIAVSVDDLLDERVSALVLADIGTMTGDSRERLEAWIAEGGVLVRFAGPRLAGAEDDTLVPTALRGGERALGGTLTWSEPQALARFSADSPFAGIAVPPDVRISRQVLAEPSVELGERTWASLADGTPLVTGNRMGQGWIVLFHVTADAAWSNLPLSGAFVEMLRRVVDLAGAGDGVGAAAQGDNGAVLRPLQTLDASGALVAPPGRARPIEGQAFAQARPSAEHPPGLYGEPDAFRALNVIGPDTVHARLDVPQLSVTAYPSDEPRPIGPWLLAAALALLVADGLAVLMLGGRGLGFGRLGRAGAGLALILALGPGAVSDARADMDDDAFALEATLDTRLAYVTTGNPEVDEVSRAGLAGLSQQLTARTALEPADPLGIDIARDELAFFPFIYWPIDHDAETPPPDVLARIDAYMKQGGTILFDTRDELEQRPGADGSLGGPGMQRLRTMLRGLDIPELEPVPSDHVVTKTFYLLQDFPGRWEGGTLWVEATLRDEDAPSRPAHNADGVSAIMITSNDFAGAWAVDGNRRPLFPASPGGDWQRELAYRAGINIIMYAMTGNYKADQVHIPALLERLGQ
jgi:hypothetical protein